MSFFRQKAPSLKYPMLALILTLALTWVYFFAGGNNSVFLLFAAFFGIGMAMAIGANDVANNMGPAVGSKALTLTGAIIIAAICEASGAIIAGGDVVNTIKGGIIDVSVINNNGPIFMAIMMATLLAAALWIAFATIFKAPVSATHSVMGALIGAGITAAGFEIVQWGEVVKIVISWVASPVLGGGIAALIMLSIRHTILKKDNVGDAAKRGVPIYVGIMTWVFMTYLLLKGLKQVIHIEIEQAIFLGYLVGILVYLGVGFYLRTHRALLKNSKKFVNRLFNVPLIFSVALLSFAHGANDVANAIGPLVAINETIKTSVGSGIIQLGDIGIPFWIMAFGALGISIGLMLFGSRLIKTVGSEITKLNQVRAFSVALSAAITVIIASQFGIPVSSTHIAIGGVFGVGLLREYIKRRKGDNKEYIEKAMIKSIALAWVITLPISALLSAAVYFIIMNVSI